MLSVFEKAKIRADVLQNVHSSLTWDVNNLKESIDRYRTMNEENDTHDYDCELEEREYKLSVFDSISKALEKLL